jgi:hypothetical protein
MYYGGKGPIVWEGPIEPAGASPEGTALMVDMPGGKPWLALATGGLVPENWRDGRRLVILVGETDDPRTAKREPWLLDLGKGLSVRLRLVEFESHVEIRLNPVHGDVEGPSAILDAAQARELAAALLRFASMAEAEPAKAPKKKSKARKGRKR